MDIVICIVEIRCQAYAGCMLSEIGLDTPDSRRNQNTHIGFVHQQSNFHITIIKQNPKASSQWEQHHRACAVSMIATSTAFCDSLSPKYSLDLKRNLLHALTISKHSSLIHNVRQRDQLTALGQNLRINFMHSEQIFHKDKKKCLVRGTFYWKNNCGF